MLCYHFGPLMQSCLGTHPRPVPCPHPGDILLWAGTSAFPLRCHVQPRMGSKKGARAAEEDKAKHSLDPGTGIPTRPCPTGNPKLTAAAPQEMPGTQARIQSSIIHLFIYGDFLPQNRTIGVGVRASPAAQAGPAPDKYELLGTGSGGYLGQGGAPDT